jgi:methionyl-tRNA formyltransferase
VAAYGLLLPQAILDAPRQGCLNIHASLLPRWRGAAPVQRAILAGDTETGVAIMQMEKGLDTGPVRLEGRLRIGRETAGELTAALAALGARLMCDVLDDLPGHPPRPQPADGVTYAHKIDKAEARIDWTLPAQSIDRLVRAMQPSPGAWFESEGRRVKLLAARPAPGTGRPGTLLEGDRIATGDGALELAWVQPEGKPRMPAADWLRGRRLRPGDPA